MKIMKQPINQLENILKNINELIQIKTDLDFSRTLFNIGTGKWKSTAILKDKGVIKTNLFLFKQE